MLVIFVFPALTFAQNWGIDVGGRGWSLSIGSGGGGAGSFGAYGLPDGSILGIVENILLWLLAILGIVGIIGFVISGIMYLISAGDEKMIENAKRAMKYSILGVVVGLAGFVALQAIYYALSGSASF